MAKEIKAVKITSDLYRVIREQVTSEKAMIAEMIGKASFYVDESATKQKVAEAVSAIFGVAVASVNILRKKPKSRRFRGVTGVRLDHKKKAIVTLVKGATIDYSSVK